MNLNKKFLLIFLIIGLLALSYFYKSQIVDESIQERAANEILMKGTLAIKQLWEEGDSKKEFRRGIKHCIPILGDLKGVYGNYLKCNPQFLDCYLYDKKEKAHFSVIHKRKKYQINVKKSFSIPGSKNEKGFYQVVTKSNSNGDIIPDYGILLELELNNSKKKHRLKIILEDSCGDTFLPERVYGFGPYLYHPDFKDWKWDNFNRSMFIDKKLVTNRDIIEWKVHGKFTSNIKPKIPDEILNKKEKWSLPASFLKKEEMRQYCAFKGKQVLQAHVFDAATFHPMSEKKIHSKRIFRTPFPWTVKRNKSFLYRAQKYEDFKLKKKHCYKAFTKDCFNFASLNKYFEESVSWIGMFQILGGYFEFLSNRLDPKENLKASSFYFKSSSPFHSLGLRTSWDGEGFLKSNFGLGEFINVGETNIFEVGFRCLKEVYVEN